MKSVAKLKAMLANLKAKLAGGAQLPLYGGRRRSKASRVNSPKPNPKRRACKTLNGTIFHGYTPRGHNAPAPSPETVRAVEVMLRVKCIVKGGKVYVLDYDNQVGHYLGERNVSAKEMVETYLALEAQLRSIEWGAILVSLKEPFRISVLKQHSVDYNICA